MTPEIGFENISLKWLVFKLPKINSLTRAGVPASEVGVARRKKRGDLEVRLRVVEGC
jgi:hypothetical protein